MSSQLINMISASFVETIIMVLISGGDGAAQNAEVDVEFT